MSRAVRKLIQMLAKRKCRSKADVRATAFAICALLDWRLYAKN